MQVARTQFRGTSRYWTRRFRVAASGVTNMITDGCAAERVFAFDTERRSASE